MGDVDICDRLRLEIGAGECCNYHRLIGDAIAEIERLRARVSELTAKLAAFCRSDGCDKAELVEANRQLRARIYDLETRLAALASGPQVSFGGWQEAPEK